MSTRVTLDVQVPAVPDREEAARIGAALSIARQAAGLSLAQCAARLSVPMSVLRRLEEGALSPLDSGVFLRGHLRSYGLLLGIDRATLDDYAQRLAPAIPPALVANGRVPSARYALERYLRAGSYIAMTIAIVAPLMWFIMHGDNGVGPRLQAIDSAPVAVVPGVSVSAPRAASQSRAPAAAAQQPLLAAMTPFVSTEAEATPAPTSGHTLQLTLDAPSWVEVTRSDGQHLEYALLQPGDYRWESSASLHVLIGNAAAARVSVDGKPYALRDTSANNVARFSIGTAPGNA